MSLVFYLQRGALFGTMLIFVHQYCPWSWFGCVFLWTCRFFGCVFFKMSTWREPKRAFVFRCRPTGKCTVSPALRPALPACRSSTSKWQPSRRRRSEFSRHTLQTSRRMSAKLSEGRTTQRLYPNRRRRFGGRKFYREFTVFNDIFIYWFVCSSWFLLHVELHDWLNYLHVDVNASSSRS